MSVRDLADIYGVCRVPMAGRRPLRTPVDCGRVRPVFRGRRLGELGQASLEYLLVGTVLMVVAAGLAALWRFAADGRFDHLVDACASHAVSTGGALDVFLF